MPAPHKDHTGQFGRPQGPPLRLQPRADKRPRSCGAFFVRARVLCPTMLLTASPLALFPGFPCARPRPPQRGSGTPRDASSQPAPCGHGARPCGGARLSASHRGSCQGDSWSPRLCTRPCFGGQSGAFDPVRPPQPGGGDLALLHGCYPRRTNLPRTVSTSRAGHDAGRLMPDAARERVTNPPAGTALAPSQGVSSRRTSLRKAR